MDVPIQLPLDSDGFLRRECPRCGQQFKWHHGPATEEAEEQPDPSTYYCPLCGESAAADSWWTQEQLGHAQGVAVPAAMRYIQDSLKQAFRNNKYVRFEPGNGSDIPDQPSALTEPDDMQIVASPCHAYEPIKIPANHEGPVHCLVCGEPFAI
jgi:hypothetical protein